MVKVMPNPQTGWQKAATIGPTGPQKAPPGEMKMGMMPWIPSGGLGTALAGLKSWLPGAGEVASGGNLGLSRAIPGLTPRPYASVTETLGELLPEYTPRGGEAMYNMGQGAGAGVADPVAAEAFRKFVAKPAMPSPRLSPFQQMQKAGAFEGDRTTGHFTEGPGGLTWALDALRKMR